MTAPACPRCGLVHPPGIRACPPGRAPAAPPPRSRGPLVVLVLVLALVLGGGAVALWVRGRGPDPRAGGVLGVSSDPPGASVVVMGRAQERATPLLVRDLPRGTRLEVRLTKPGYRPWTGHAVIPVERGDERLRATLEPLPGAGPASAPASAPH